MAGSWLSSLGGKLLDTGAAYLQQVSVVQKLQALPREEARQLYQQFVAGLTPAARAGFALTLASLANRETHLQTQRFLLSMRDALNEPARWLADATPAAATALPAAARPAAAPPPAAAEPAVEGLREIADQIDAWMELPGGGGARAAAEFLHALPVARLQAWAQRLAEFMPALDRHITNHRDNEARIAAGRYIEDQRHYRLLRLAGGPPDAGWLQELRKLEAARRFSAELLEAAQSIATARARMAAAPVSAVQRAPPPPPPPAPATPAAQAGRDTGIALSQIAALRDELESELASGHVLGERQHIYRRLIDKIEDLHQQSTSGRLTSAEVVKRLGGLIESFMPHLAAPGDSEQRATPAGRVLLRHVGEVKLRAMREMARWPPEATFCALNEFAGDMSQAQKQAAELRSEAELLAIETGLVRPAARALRELLLTHHALLARPLWACGTTARLANQVFVADSMGLDPLLSPIAQKRGFTLANPKRGQNHGQMRWDALLASHVAVFDLRAADRLTALSRTDPDHARRLCAAGYELGQAFALGLPVLVVVGPDDVLPFDVDIEPLRLDARPGEGAAGQRKLSEALDQCFYGLQRPPQGSSMAATLDRLRDLTARHPERRGIEKMGWLDDALVKDPASFAAAVEQLALRLPAPSWHLLRPCWPAAYPRPDDRRCFHIMPFGQPWSDEVRDVARSACRDRGFVYRRGDEAEEGRIIEAIWDDLCRSQVALVELGGPNLNVMIELGMAHAIGRPTLVVQHGASLDIRPPHIAKQRVFNYADASNLMGILVARLEFAATAQA